jgi:hypothetical protein
VPVALGNSGSSDASDFPFHLLTLAGAGNPKA